jgi:hypothetical protein
MSILVKRYQAMRIVPALAAAFAMTAFAGESLAVSQNAGSRTFLRLCPTHIGGDREFKGHGPEVDASVTLRRAAGNEQVVLDVYLHEIETTSDWSEAEYSRTHSLISAPSGHPYSFIWAPNATGAFAWVSLNSNAPTYGSAIINYTDTDHALDRFFNPQWWVSEIAIIGDTGGNDIGNCTTDDAYITVRLPAIWFWYS